MGQAVNNNECPTKFRMVDTYAKDLEDNKKGTVINIKTIEIK